MTTYEPDAIAARIKRLDPAFRPLIKVVGPPPKRAAVPSKKRFAFLTRSITFQLLATKAANTIHGRVLEACENDVTPTSLLRVGHDRLREAGLSNAKAATMLTLAQASLDGELRVERHGRMSDQEVSAELTALRGIGPWTAQMYLMSALGRHDVWPTLDLGVRNGWNLLHEPAEALDERALRAAADHLTGVRSSVAWYCWRAIDLAREGK